MSRGHEKFDDTHALQERVKISEEHSVDVLRFHKLNRIRAIHATLAIEGNRLTLEQVRDVIEGKLAWEPLKDVKEAGNSWEVDTIDLAAETGEKSPNVPENVPENSLSGKILAMLRADPKASAQKLAPALRVSDKTVKRHLKALREAGRLRRVGPDKGGRWEVVGK